MDPGFHYNQDKDIVTIDQFRDMVRSHVIKGMFIPGVSTKEMVEVVDIIELEAETFFFEMRHSNVPDRIYKVLPFASLKYHCVWHPATGVLDLMRVMDMPAMWDRKSPE